MEAQKIACIDPGSEEREDANDQTSKPSLSGVASGDWSCRRQAVHGELAPGGRAFFALPSLPRASQIATIISVQQQRARETLPGVVDI